MCVICICTLHCDVQDVWKLWVMHGVYRTLHLRDKGQSLIVLYLPGIAVLQGWARDWKRAGPKALASLDMSSRPSPGIWPWQIARTWTALRRSQSGLAGSPGKLTKLWPSSTLSSTFSCTQKTLGWGISALCRIQPWHFPPLPWILGWVMVSPKIHILARMWFH